MIDVINYTYQVICTLIVVLYRKGKEDAPGFAKMGLTAALFLWPYAGPGFSGRNSLGKQDAQRERFNSDELFMLIIIVMVASLLGRASHMF